MRITPVRLFAFFFFAASAQAGSEISIAPLPAPKSPSPSRAKVSAQLAKRTAAIRKEARECAQPDPGEAEFHSRSQVLIDTPTLYSLEVIGDDACPGAAHPSSWQYGLTYDMTTGRRYNPLKLYAIGDAGKDGMTRLAPAAAKLVKAELLRHADAECRTAVDEQLPHAGMSFGLSLQGFNVYFDAAHAVQACFFPINLPYGQIRDFLSRREAARLHWRL